MSSTGLPKKCQQEKTFDPLAQKSKQICLPIDQAKCQQIVQTPALFRAELAQWFQEFPALFPRELTSGQAAPQRMKIS
jgi:hypothetical protein